MASLTRLVGPRASVVPLFPCATRMARCVGMTMGRAPSVVSSLKAHRSFTSGPLCGSTFRRTGVVSPPTHPHWSVTLRSRGFASNAILSIEVPAMGDSVTEGKIMSLAKQAGDPVYTDDIIATIETDKVEVEVRVPKDGVIMEFLVKDGDVVPVGAVIARIDPTAALPKAKPAKPAKPAAAPTPPPPPPPPPAPSAPPPATPKPPAEPVRAPPVAPVAAPPATPSMAPPPAAPAPKPSPPIPIPSPSTGGRRDQRVTMSRMRLRIAERMKEAQNRSAMLTTFQEADMTNLMGLRNALKDEFNEKHGVKLGFMSAFVAASAKALVAHPNVNAGIDDRAQEIVYHEYVDISVAVATPKGLVVPVVHDADKLSFADIEKTIANLAERARTNQIELKEMEGGTFTISNGGVYGSMMGTPILNPPQSAILGMHSIVNRPVVIEKEIVTRPMMYLALTYDHRLVDGRDAVLFLRHIKSQIEDPRRMLLGL